MTPIEQMHEAASRHPLLTARLMPLKPEDRNLHLHFLRLQVKDLGLTHEEIDLDLIQGHVEISVLSRLFK